MIDVVDDAARMGRELLDDAGLTDWTLGIYEGYYGDLGTTWDGIHLILISGPMLRLNPEQADLTVMHEVAHAFDAVANGGKGHGASWRQIDLLLGDPAPMTMAPIGLPEPLFTMPALDIMFIASMVKLMHNGPITWVGEPWTSNSTLRRILGV